MWSRVMASLASVTGWRKLAEATMVPRRMVVVAVANPVNQGIVACHGRSR